MLLKTRRALIFLFICAPFIYSFSAPGIWVFEKEQDGIRIYSRHSEHSKFDDIKVVTDFTGNASQIISILSNVAKYTDWVYATKSSVLMKKISNTEFVYYSELDVPWPSANRDFYSHCRIIADHASRSFKFIAESIKDYAPEKKNIIRVALSNGTWNISTVTEKKIHVEFVLEFDPGGTVPAWLLNLFSTKGPMETFTNLKKRMLLLNK